VSQELLKKLAIAFDNDSVPYMVFGGQAVLIYGEPRLTRDIDITLGLEPHQAKPVLQIIEQLGLKLRIDNVEEFLAQTFVLPALDPETQFRLDFVFSLTDFERQAIARSRIVEIDGVPVRYISLEDLIVTKIIAGRPRDLEDVKGVILKNPEYNRELVEKCLQMFDQELDCNFTTTFEDILPQITKG
jgi:predicted nucleotidyltransferase